MSQVASTLNALHAAIVNVNTRVARLESTGRAPAAVDDRDARFRGLDERADELQAAIDAVLKRVDASASEAAKQRKLSEAATIARFEKQLAAGIHAAVAPLREAIREGNAISEKLKADAATRQASVERVLADVSERLEGLEGSVDADE